jgi:nucleoside phosphorylase
MTAGRRPFDVGLVVPLGEEFDYILEVLPKRTVFVQDGRYFYELDCGLRTVLCCIASDMGTLPALHTALHLLTIAEVRLLALVGVAGGLTSDVALGDVIVADDINEFQAKAKAVGDANSYSIQYSGRHWSLPWAVREAVNNFRFAARELHEAWQEQCRRHHNACFEVGGVLEAKAPKYHVGPIASGNTVSAAEAFVDELKTIDRKVAAIEMEAAGVAWAASARIRPVPCIVLRGISDPSTGAKTATDQISGGAFRRCAVFNAAALLKNLLSWDHFCLSTAIVAEMDRGTPTAPPTADLLSALKNELGGAWLIGVLSGAFTHAPCQTEDCTPVDVSRLRATDSEFSAWLGDAEACFQEYSATKRVPATAEHLASLLRTYRERFGSEVFIKQLAEFDSVVCRIFVTPTEDDSGPLLLESERIEEEIGAAAAVELLKPFATNAHIRARLIDLLSIDSNWAEIVALLASVPVDGLSRLELEHFITASVHLGRDAKMFLKVHASRYTDKAGLLFRQLFA